MGLKAKFNLVMLAAFLVGLALAAALSWRIVQENARHEVVQEATIMMAQALAIREYTVKEIRPLLADQVKVRFLPHTVPSWAAQTNLRALSIRFPDYAYKEAALNPTNPRDRASDWEADVVNNFRQTTDSKELVGERDTPTGRALYLARPIQITNAACLVCHSTPDAAPRTMIDLYGTANGFGWKHNEIIGAQIVSVPMSVPILRANQTFRTFMLSLTSIFLATFVLLNVMLHMMVIRPVTRLAALADQVSLGNFDAGEFKATGSDEIGVLTEALGRMKTSLVQAMKMLET